MPTPPCNQYLRVPKEKEGSTTHAQAVVMERKEVAKGGKKAETLEKKPSMDINESAEAFIQKFRQQLLIQRLESIENYEQMLARGL